MRIDWAAVAREVNDYLDKLEPNERPMPCGVWTYVLGISRKTLGQRAMRYPDQDFGQAVARHRAIDAAWLASFEKAAAATRTEPAYVRKLALQFGITDRQAENLVARARANGTLPKPYRRWKDLAARIISVAKVGMTRRDLAAAAGVTGFCLENYVRRDATGAVADQLRKRIAWSVDRPYRIVTINRSKTTS